MLLDILLLCNIRLWADYRFLGLAAWSRGLCFSSASCSSGRWIQHTGSMLQSTATALEPNFSVQFLVLLLKHSRAAESILRLNWIDRECFHKANSIWRAVQKCWGKRELKLVHCLICNQYFSALWASFISIIEFCFNKTVGLNNFLHYAIEFVGLLEEV